MRPSVPCDAGPARQTKQRIPVRNEEQRRQGRRARCNRVHSAVTPKVKMNEDDKVNIHATLEMFTSGQLLFLGLMPAWHRRLSLFFLLFS